MGSNVVGCLIEIRMRPVIKRPAKTKTKSEIECCQPSPPLRDAGITTYVVGFGGYTAVDPDTLHESAIAAGTPREPNATRTKM